MEKLHLYDKIISPLVTEKSTIQGESGKYVFEVSKSASKKQISSAVEWAFEVRVLSVNVITRQSQFKYYPKNLYS